MMDILFAGLIGMIIGGAIMAGCFVTKDAFAPPAKNPWADDNEPC
ncbi:hypothetical protein [Brucella anthropi]